MSPICWIQLFQLSSNFFLCSFVVRQNDSTDLGVTLEILKAPSAEKKIAGSANENVPLQFFSKNCLIFT